MSAADKLLHRAVQQGDVAQCQSFILEGGANVDHQNEGGETALHIACEVGGRFSVMELLLGYGADPNICRSAFLGGGAPIHQAVKKRQYREVNLLIEKGANCNLSDGKGRIPLHYAAEAGDFEMCRLLLLSGNSVYNVTDKEGRTPQFLATLMNFKAVADWLGNPKQLEADDRPALNENESKVVTVVTTTLGLNARLK